MMRGCLRVGASSVLLLVGTSQPAHARDGLDAPRCTVSGEDDEGPPTTVSDQVERVAAGSGDRIAVAVRRHAQMYFLFRTHAQFEELLRRLKEAEASERRVRCTFRRYSG